MLHFLLVWLERDGEWYADPDAPRPPRLTMRRYVNGHWEYREATPEEESDYVSNEAW